MSVVAVVSVVSIIVSVVSVVVTVVTVVSVVVSVVVPVVFKVCILQLQLFTFHHKDDVRRFIQEHLQCVSPSEHMINIHLIRVSITVLIRVLMRTCVAV